jgi:Na+/melibiose symporter-like transporter
MNLDDLMAVWRSQDAAPLHGVNETLLRLALRQDEAKVQAQRRLESLIVYVMSAGLIAGMAVFVVMIFGMLFFNDDDVITAWDFTIPIVGAIAAVLMSVALHRSRRAQTLREQRFGESVRDQLGRRIAQLDYEATIGTRAASLLLSAIFIAATAILVASIRVNLEPNETFGWGRILRVILVIAFMWAATVWAQRRSVKRDVLPRKRRLEALLKELDG